jgi:hypothetical protein
LNTLRMAAVSFLVCLFWLEAVRLAGADAPADQSTVSKSGSDSRYVIFTLGGLEDIHDPAQETPFKQRLSKLVEELKAAFHRTPDDASRFVGFTPGLTRVQNLPARELEARVVAALDVAEETDMPVFFHLDDMHFCYDRADLFGDGESAEWSAFPKSGETHGPIVERY